MANQTVVVFCNQELGDASRRCCLIPSTCRTCTELKALRGNTSTFNYGLPRAWRNATVQLVDLLFQVQQNPEDAHISLLQYTCTRSGCRQRYSDETTQNGQFCRGSATPRQGWGCQFSWTKTIRRRTANLQVRQ
jgi:hypothetical protein